MRLMLVFMAALALVSCKMVAGTFKMESRLYVRVPCGIVDPVTQDGWCFRHVVEGPYDETAVRAPRSQWYVAWRTEDRRDQFRGSGILPPWGRTRDLAPELAEACRVALGAYPNLIEPGLVFKKDVAVPETKPDDIATPPAGEVPVVEVAERPRRMWPWKKDESGYLDPEWHLDAKHTQLADARLRAREAGGGGSRAITIGVIDTGFDARHVALPPPGRIIDKKEGDTMQEQLRENEQGNCDKTCNSERTTPGQSLGDHGMGALGILAGRKVEIVDRDHPGHSRPAVFMDENGRGRQVEIGAAPDATFVPVRVAAGPASLSTANFAAGIDYASRVKKCDVISMSHGGSPSMMWADAINAAYQRGTAMFAATGDYFTLFPCIPWLPGRTGVGLPSSTVYPAGWRRVMSVAGVTEGGKPYALTDGLHFATGLWDLRSSSIKHIFMRGNYGADGVRRSMWDIFGSTAAKERYWTDQSMIRRHNELRANPICAYTHAIPWLEIGEAKDKTAPNGVHLSGSGTSSAAPQAAAAAAHWLAVHRKEIERAGQWRGWRKAEAVYIAMTLKADRPWERQRGGEPVLENQRPDQFRGAGILRAADMLDVSFADATKVRGTTLSFPHDGCGRYRDGTCGGYKDSVHGAPRDFYDGERSFFSSVFRSGSRERTKGKDRENLLQQPYRKEAERFQALTQLYHNMLLVEQWQHGVSPEQMGEGEGKHPLLKRGEELAAAVCNPNATVEHAARKPTSRLWSFLFRKH